MAKESGKQRGGFVPGLGAFLILAFLVLILAGGTTAVTWILGQRSAVASADTELQGSHAVLRLQQQQRYQQLRYISRLFATDQLLTSYLAEAAQQRDLVSVLDSIEEYQNLLNFELAVVLDRNGRVLTRTDNHDASGEDLSTTPLVKVALEEREAFGVWKQNDRLYHAVAVPLVRQFDLVGYIIAAFPIHEAVALQVKRTSGADTVFLANSGTGPMVVASTLPTGQAEELITALRKSGGVLDQVTQEGTTEDRVELELESGKAMAFLAPLQDAAQKAVGASVTVTLLDQRRAQFHRILLVLGALTLASLVLGLIFNLTLAGRAAGPMSRLVAVAEQAAQGNLDVVVPQEGSGEVRRVGGALTQILSAAREKTALEYFVGRVTRYLPEPAKVGGVRRPEALEVALVGVEMRRFANPKLGYDPEENLGRFAQDLRRISTAVTTYGGRVEAVYGHRVLAIFEAENAAVRGLSAATELLLLLSERQSVFDEPEPPAVAITSGGVVTGSVVWGDRPGLAVAGVPVQQLESLLREATPGALYFSNEVYQQIGSLFQRAGIQVKAQRGLLSPQPLLVVSGEEAARATGVTAASISAGTNERRNLTDVVPGAVLGSRFDVLAELGAGRTGLVIKARDREVGDLVTLKMLKPEVVADAARFEHLKGAIGTARGIQHPQVLRVLDFGEVDGMPYISCEFVRAMTLRQMLDHCRQIPVVAALNLFRQICSGVQAGHQERLLHRGVTPQNILVEPNGAAKVMDFGITAPPQAGVMMAGAAYLAPEQLAGQQAMDPRGDVYSCGVVMYEMLTGQVPYPGGTIEEVRQKVMSTEVAPPSSLAADMPPALEQVVLRLLRKQAEERYGSMVDLLADLEEIRF